MRSPPSQDVAVSPAIGTILLVAMTVIFVALVAVVVMGLAGGMFDMKQVGLTLKPYAFSGENPEHGIGFIVHGGVDAGDLVSLSAVITGPELTYAKTKNNSVEGPQVGQEYRMAAHVDPKILDLIKRGNYNPVNLITTGKDSAAEIECYVTVTGKFRDGTEQVLLVQKVTIPAIPGTDGSMSDKNGWISVVPYYINDVYPAHGFMVTILNQSVMKGKETPTFEVILPVEHKMGSSITVTEMAIKSTNNEKTSQYTYDLSPPNGDSWKKTPYPDTSSDHWVLGELTGNVTVPLQVDNKQESVTVGPITIPPRVNIFENTTRIAGKLKKEINQITVTFDPSTTLKSMDPNFIVFYSGDNSKSINQTQIQTNNPTSATFPLPNETDLEKHSGENLDVFVLVDIESKTQVWYRVASVPVSDLLQKT